ncbi:globin [Paenibacillus sp. HN-1]|uniref:globin domain-containing protein n=1 Tax=Paenibacillus TaxID=44249 RepID=UPI001CA8E2E3|nr:MULTISPECIES: globin [Paenibacillus]MBY9078889.1 globin [Paenibacillus sp. CGMCC 1.18879]MBY9082875.1 globin [Paenibacillus sinensis]
MNPHQTLYENLGGAEGLRRLVEVFYSKVQAHPQLGPLFPADIAPVMDKQYLFLTQFFGGPSLYSDQHGHPMMRARHMHVPISPEKAEDWLGCMDEALREVGTEEELRTFVIGRLAGPARHFVNTPPERQ